MIRHGRSTSGAVRGFLRGAIGVALLATFQPVPLHADQQVAQRAAPIRATQAHPSQHGPYYLALGDSFTAGARLCCSNLPGFARLFFQSLQRHGVKGILNLACPGESASSFIAGGCPGIAQVPNSYDGYPNGAASQLTAALAFIHAHRGRVPYVTLLLGFNDVNGDGPTTPWCRVVTTDAALRELDADLHTILSRLRAALGRSGRIIALNYYDAWQNRCVHASAKRASSIVTLDTHIARAAAPFHIPVADLFTAFRGRTTPNRHLCHLTYVCTQDQDPHPTPAGHALIASTLVRLLNRLHL